MLKSFTRFRAGCQVSSDGETTWFEGALLIGVYTPAGFGIFLRAADRLSGLSSIHPEAPSNWVSEACGC
ncbi:MAG: hypothetical protein ABIN96_16615 [Rubrivivax sp.]